MQNVDFIYQFGIENPGFINKEVNFINFRNFPLYLIQEYTSLI
jgi:hypothetical protein